MRAVLIDYPVLNVTLLCSTVLPGKDFFPAADLLSLNRSHSPPPTLWLDSEKRSSTLMSSSLHRSALSSYQQAFWTVAHNRLTPCAASPPLSLNCAVQGLIPNQKLRNLLLKKMHLILSKWLQSPSVFSVCAWSSVLRYWYKAAVSK